MKRIALSRQWQFQYGPGSAGHEAAKEWETVDLPHDGSIGLPRTPHAVGGPSNAYIPGAVCWYEKEIDVPAEWMGKPVFLEVEGAYMNTVVLINKQMAGRWPYGYTTFHCDLSPWLKEGKNQLRIEVSNGGLANTRWYSGSGLYRPVWLLVGDTVSVSPWDVTITTPVADRAKSQVTATTSLRSTVPEATGISLRSTILDAGKTMAEKTEAVTFVSGAAAPVLQSFNLSPARLWCPEDPYLYTLRTEVLCENQVLDMQETSFGIREVSVDANNGFQLNGVPMKLKGGCVHHDCGLLGAAAHPRAEARKVELLLESGFNAVRCAHNPPSPAFLDACDRLGMLVIDEAFDCWRHGKNPGDYNQFFEEWWRRDLTAMVKRDRNHPSVIMWSTGNEIIERDGRSGAAVLSAQLADAVRALDSTRPVTNALCDLWEEKPENEPPEAAMDRFDKATDAFAEPLDVVGYNYLLHRYPAEAKRHPGRVLCGTETFPKDAFDYWEATATLPYVIGDFVWTSLDYLGEAGIGHVKTGEDDKNFHRPYPWNHANCGDIDICGVKRPQSHYRDFVWGLAHKPYIAVHAPEAHGKAANPSPWGWPEVSASWNWPGWDEKPCTVDVYCGEEEVALLLDGVEIGRQPAGKAHKYLASFETVYRPGKLEAIGYLHGAPVSHFILETSGPAVALKLSADRTVLDGGHGDLAYVQVELLDDSGRLVTDGDTQLFFTVQGAGKVLAVGNGNPASDESYTGNMRKAWRGLATAVLRTEWLDSNDSQETNDLVLTVTGEGITPASLHFFISGRSTQ